MQDLPFRGRNQGWRDDEKIRRWFVVEEIDRSLQMQWEYALCSWKMPFEVARVKTSQANIASDTFKLQMWTLLIWDQTLLAKRYSKATQETSCRTSNISYALANEVEIRIFFIASDSA